MLEAAITTYANCIKKIIMLYNTNNSNFHVIKCAIKNKVISLLYEELYILVYQMVYFYILQIIKNSYNIIEYN